MKKQILSGILAGAIMLTSLAVPTASVVDSAIEVQASGGGPTEYYGDWAYYQMYNSDGTADVYIKAYMGDKTSVTIPSEINGNTVKYIEGLGTDPEIASYDSKLTTVTIPSTVISVISSDFEENLKLTTIKVDSDNKYYSASNGILYNKDKTELVCYPIGKTASSFTIPSGVEKIAYAAFYNCTNLKSITVPKSVTNIDYIAMGYKYTESSYEAKMSNFVIKGYSSSAAEAYAEENDIVFKNVKTSKYVIPTVETSTFSATSTAIRINWRKVTGATGYRIYRYNTTTKKWVKVATVKGAATTSYKQTGLKSGTTYKYKVKAYRKVNGKVYWGSASETIKTRTDLAKVTITSASKTTTAIRLNWKKVTGACGYQIQLYDTKTKKWKSYKTIKSGSTLTYRTSGLSKGTVYKFRIRAYRTVNGDDEYGSWSATKKVTTKS